MRWSGYASPHKLAEALSLLLPLLPLDSRARTACVSRAWRAATTHPSLWEELSFERCAARVTNAVVALLCARAGAALRTLRLDSGKCSRVTGAGMLAALRDGGCIGLLRLNLLLTERPRHQMLTAVPVRQLVVACPQLQHAVCALECSMSEAAAAVTALTRGQLVLMCTLGDSACLMQLAECLRVNTTVTTLFLVGFNIDDTGASQLAECLHVNATLTALWLSLNLIGDEGAVRMAQCLRENTTLTSLDLSSNSIGVAGATQLVEACASTPRSPTWACLTTASTPRAHVLSKRNAHAQACFAYSRREDEI